MPITLTNDAIDACNTLADLQKLIPSAEKLVAAAKFGLKSSLRGENDRALLKQAKALKAAGKI